MDTVGWSSKRSALTSDQTAKQPVKVEESLLLVVRSEASNSIATEVEPEEEVDDNDKVTSHGAAFTGVEDVVWERRIDRKLDVPTTTDVGTTGVGTGTKAASVIWAKRVEGMPKEAAGGVAVDQGMAVDTSRGNGVVKELIAGCVSSSGVEI